MVILGMILTTIGMIQPASRPVRATPSFIYVRHQDGGMSVWDHQGKRALQGRYNYIRAQSDIEK